MLNEIVKDDTILKFLIKETNITNIQLDTLLINSLLYNNLKLNEKISMRDDKLISKGSFCRTLKQAENNIKRSIYTIIIAEYLSLFNKDTFHNLVRISNILIELKESDIDIREKERIINKINLEITSICKKNR
jgi:hypothetical protein